MPTDFPTRNVTEVCGRLLPRFTENFTTVNCLPDFHQNSPGYEFLQRSMVPNCLPLISLNLTKIKFTSVTEKSMVTAYQFYHQKSPELTRSLGTALPISQFSHQKSPDTLYWKGLGTAYQFSHQRSPKNCQRLTVTACQFSQQKSPEICQRSMVTACQFLTKSHQRFVSGRL